MKLNDLTGKKFGRLTVIRRVENSKWNETQWLCKCDCGKEIKVSYGKLSYGHTKSCGCYAIDLLKENSTKHHKRNTRLYYIWANMKQRCFNKNQYAYKWYGDRGITICDEWIDKENGFMSFYNWAMSNGYRDDLTIDRIDNNGNYEPSNCRWATNLEQSNNKRNNVYITINKETHTLVEWLRKSNISQSTYYRRLKKGWDIEQILTTPTKKYNKLHN